MWPDTIISRKFSPEAMQGSVPI